MESRVCTTNYSDECFTEFCNTTRTWKITCPCKGRMCNVRDVPRERELFDILNKLVDKTYKNYRAKRSNIMNSYMKAQLDRDHAKPHFVVKRSIPIPYQTSEPTTEQDSANTPLPKVWATTTPRTGPIPTQYTTPLKTRCGSSNARTERKHFQKRETESEERKHEELIEILKRIGDAAKAERTQREKNNAVKLYTNISFVFLGVFVLIINLSIIYNYTNLY